MKFTLKIMLVITLFSSCMLVIITTILLYKGHEHLTMLSGINAGELIHHFDMALRETAIWSVGILFIVIIISSMVIAKILSKPIKEMNNFALQLVRGKRQLALTYMVDDQIGQLGTSLKKLDETLSMYEKRRKEMTQDLAHEIRNPLASLKSYLTAINEGVWEATPERLHACMEEVDRLTLLIRELDILNDINNPTFKIKRKQEQVAPFIEEVVLALARELLTKQINVPLDLDQQVYAEIDGLRLKQILHNIIKNAIMHVATNGTITIQLAQKENVFLIMIRDDGMGMNEDALNHLFHRNYRGNHHYHGNGIGMTITEKLVKAHQGYITVESKEMIGTTFFIEIPLTS